MLVHLQLGLSVKDVCVRFRTSEGTCSHLFTTWICFLQRSSDHCSHFLHANKLMIDCQGILRNIFLICEKTIGYYKIECQHPASRFNSSITDSQFKSRNMWKTLIGCTPFWLVSLVSGCWGGRISDHEITEKNLGL